MTMKCFYEDVLKGDLKRIKDRSPKFPEFVLRSALQDGRRDVVDILLTGGVEFDAELIKMAQQQVIQCDVALTTIDYVMVSLLPIILSVLIYILCFN